ncbi:MAG TPA: trehalose-phosphatase [Candidatus Dormibacteraeota bacterium]|nr:trehalose-phosphatase [Candidatus Dormibacteraeota bacterium]
MKSQTIAQAWRDSVVADVPPGELVLITDFDGTLADVVPDPARAAARPESLDALRRLVEVLADVIVLSSRTPSELEGLVPISGVRLIGDSGLALPRLAQKQALDQFNHDVSRLLERIPGTSLEAKPASSAVHFRNSDITAEEMIALLKPLLDGGRLAAALGRKVVEVHAPKAGKGSALAALLPAVDPAGVVCLGDDENDRTMFEYVGSVDYPHMSVGVDSPEAPKDLFHLCDVVVWGPEEAAVFLQAIVEWANSAPG